LRRFAGNTAATDGTPSVSNANLLFLWRDQKCCQPFHTGVSLHSHTMHSRESLAFIPQYMRDIPLVPRQLRRQEQRYQEMTGKPLDYNGALWPPPLPPVEACELETEQIDHTPGLRAL